MTLAHRSSSLIKLIDILGKHFSCSPDSFSSKSAFLPHPCLNRGVPFVRVANAFVISGLRYRWTCWFIVHLHSSNRLAFIQQHVPASFGSTPPHITPFEQNHSVWLFIRSCRSCKSQFPASYSPPFHFFTLIFLSKNWPFQHASVAAFSHLCHKIHPGLSSNPCKSEHLRAADLPLRQNYAHVGIGKETGEGGGGGDIHTSPLPLHP